MILIDTVISIMILLTMLLVRSKNIIIIKKVLF